jgi:oxygen-dependent protoporphyrinogen oxidase
MTEPDRFDVAVVGAGISGLSAAFRLQQAGARVVLIEGSSRVGGALRTLQQQGFTFELGPNTVLEKPPVASLLADAGLVDGRVEAAPGGKKRWIWKGALHAMPAGPLSLLRTPLFPFGAKVALAKEPFVAKPLAEREETIAQFVRRRLGQAWLEGAVGPFVSGVYAGDPDRLSVRWAVPRIYALERDHGSLIRGALAKRKGPAPGGAMIGFRGGFGELAVELARRIGDLRIDTPVTRLERAATGFRLQTREATIAAGKVLLAVPAEVTAELLAQITDGRSMALAEIPYARVAVACLGYRREQVQHPLDGFGFLVARGTGLRVLGCLFSSSLFPGRAPAGHVGLTVFVGGATDPEIVAAPDEELAHVVQTDLAVALGVRGEPVFRHLQRWRRAIPQYEVGHGRFVELVAALEAEVPGLGLAGNWTGGVSVPDAIAHGAEVAARLLGNGTASAPPPAVASARS